METEISFLETIEKKNIIIAANISSEFVVFSYYTMQELYNFNISCEIPLITGRVFIGFKNNFKRPFY